MTKDQSAAYWRDKLDRFRNDGSCERELMERLALADSRPVGEPKVAPDILLVRSILHAYQRAMTPPDSGWGDMSYIRGSYDDLPHFKAALAALRAARPPVEA